MSQLYRYFSVTPAKIAVLTNGVHYMFFADLDEPNRMDDRPFLELNLLEIKDPRTLNDLKRFSKGGFDIDEVIPAAVNLKYTKEIKRIFDDQLSLPDPNFVKFFASDVYSGKKTAQVIRMFTEITKNALKQYISERITERLQSALREEAEPQQPKPDELPGDSGEERKEVEVGITADEMEASYMVKGIIAGLVDPERIIFRDYAKGCRVLIDNNRQPVCHIVANESDRYFSVFNEDKTTETISLSKLQDVYQHADRLKAIVNYYGSSAEKGKNMSDYIKGNMHQGKEILSL
jgi:hypothetical protein